VDPTKRALAKSRATHSLAEDVTHILVLSLVLGSQLPPQDQPQKPQVLSPEAGHRSRNFPPPFCPEAGDKEML
jgi:hypothetical protein